MAVFYCLVLCVMLITCSAEYNNKGDDCIVRQTGETGECMNFSNCTAAVTLSGLGTFPQMCSCADATVCCGPTSCPPLKPGTVNIEETGYRAWDYCISLASKAYPCEESANGMTRGDICPSPDNNQTDGIIYTGEGSHLVRLGFGDADITWNTWQCSGSLISERWILSEAMCILANTGEELKYAGLGQWANNSFDPNAIYLVQRYIIHPDFQKGSSLYNDIGLVQLEREVKFSSKIFPACLHTGTPIPDDGITYTYWYSQNFYKSAMEKISWEECVAAYPVQSHLPQGVNVSTQMCTKRKANEGICGYTNPKGAPLQVTNTGRVACTQLLLGVFTLGTEFCPYSLSTRIAPFIPWIESIVWV